MAVESRAFPIALVLALAAIAAACALALSCAGSADPPEGEVVELSASYGGPTSAGTVIDRGSDISVFARLSDGSWARVEGWTLDGAATLERGGFASLEVGYAGHTARVDVECTDVDEGEFKRRCVPVTRVELVADPDLDAGMKVRVTGTVCQVNAPASDGGPATCYVSGNGAFSTPADVASVLGSGQSVSGLAAGDLIAVALPQGSEVELSKYDDVVVWGRFLEMREVEVVGGEPVQVPLVSCKYLDVQG